MARRPHHRQRALDRSETSQSAAEQPAAQPLPVARAAPPPPVEVNPAPDDESPAGEAQANNCPPPVVAHPWGSLPAEIDLSRRDHVWTLPRAAGAGEGSGGEGGAAAAQFDLTLYQGTVEFNPTNNPIIAQYITFDSDITWYAQWGKVAEFKFRATMAGSPQQAPAPLIPGLVPLVRLRGLGLFADDYHEILPVHVGTLGSEPDVEIGSSVAPAVIRQVDSEDWTQGYDFMLQQGIYVPPVGKDQYLRAGTMLTSAMYFRNGECILDDPQYVQVGA